jgi:DNA-binding CsgD family transcriptional regulator
LLKRERKDREEPAETGIPAKERRRAHEASLFFALCGLVDSLHCGLFLISRKGQLLLANDKARRLCAEASSGFAVRRQVLMISGKGAHEWVADLPKSEDIHTIKLTDGNGKGKPVDKYRLQIFRTTLRRAGDPVALMIYDSHRRCKIASGVLRQLYGLTPSEAATAECLFAGLTVDNTADELDVSVNTVRSHMKRIFMKCQVKSQVELVRLLALGPGVE